MRWSANRNYIIFIYSIVRFPLCKRCNKPLRCRRRTTNSFIANESAKHASFMQYVLFKTNFFQWEYPTIADRYLCGRRRNRTSITLKTIGCFIVSFYTTFLSIQHVGNYSIGSRYGPVASAGFHFYLWTRKFIILTTPTQSILSRCDCSF